MEVVAGDVEPVEYQFETDETGQCIEALPDECQQVALYRILIDWEVTVGVAF